MRVHKTVIQCVAATVVLAALLSGDPARAQQSVISKKSDVTFTGRLHAQYHTSSVEDVSPSSSFYVRRARLAAEYRNLAGTMRGKVQYDIGAGSPKLKDGYVDLLFGGGLNVRLGQFKKPFSLWELTSSKRTMVIERANGLIGSAWKSTNSIIIKDGLYGDRDIGVMLHGTTGALRYNLGLFNGNGNNKKSDDDDGKQIGGRLVYSLSDDLALGAGVSSRTVSDFVDPVRGDTTSTRFQAYEIDLDYGIRHDVSRTGAWVQAELLYGANPVFGDDANFSGINVVGSYNLNQAGEGRIYSLRPAIRFDYSKRDTDDDDTANILLTPGLDIFFDKYNRVQINLDIDRSQMDGADTEFGLRIQFQQII